VPDRRNSKKTKDERVRFVEQLQTYKPEQVLCLDETGFNRHMDRLFAWSQIGTSPRVVVPSAKGTNITACVVISTEGVEEYDVRVGAYNTSLLEDFIKTWSDEKYKGKVLVMDNVVFHHAKKVFQIPIMYFE